MTLAQDTDRELYKLWVEHSRARQRRDYYVADLAKRERNRAKIAEQYQGWAKVTS